MARRHWPRRRGSPQRVLQQSSFATRVIATARNAVRAARFPLELAGPLGCGIQTGVGAVLNTLRIEAGASLAVFGASGTVGLSP
ncbi:MAG: hypothetical protein R3E65_06200 [Steroidobacteraceae bacterium]